MITQATTTTATTTTTTQLQAQQRKLQIQQQQQQPSRRPPGTGPLANTSRPNEHSPQKRRHQPASQSEPPFVDVPRF